MKESVYLYAKGVFTIRDPCLGIDLNETYPFPEQTLRVEEGEEGILPPSFTGIVECNRHDRSLKSRSAYKEGVLHGPSYTFFTDGKTASERWYVKGLLHGKALDFSSAHMMLCEKGYTQGLLHGPFIRKYPSGNILSSGTFDVGWAQGCVKVFDEEGLLFRSTEFKDGRRHGVDQGWTDDGYFLFCEVWEAGEKRKIIVKDFLL